MKKIIFLTLVSLLVVCCKENSDGSEKPEERILLDSSGKINLITVVTDNSLWEGEVGDTIRDLLAAPFKGLPQDEPIFNLAQMPTTSFTGFVKRSRSFLRIEKSPKLKKSLMIKHNVYAKPQTSIVITGATDEDIISEITKNSSKIIEEFQKTEIKEKQRRIKKSLKSDEKLNEKFGLSLNFPTAYRYATEGKNFTWIRKDIPKGLMEILIYQVPLNAIDKDTSTIVNIIKMRDSIGSEYVPGPVEGSYMVTEEAYAPYLFKTKINGHFAYETRGTWEVKNAFMAGPFVNYAIRDEENNRYLVLEGFVFRPAKSKRNEIFELDAILKSAKLK
ncbi:DUF4837 family protein [Zunongwangia sp.]|uniref:DUF4837 family protein n=1 Tax=Zunongwangia sp. TaxID=1965325 RepID=UPI003AA85990